MAAAGRVDCKPLATACGGLLRASGVVQLLWTAAVWPSSGLAGWARQSSPAPLAPPPPPPKWRMRCTRVLAADRMCTAVDRQARRRQRPLLRPVRLSARPLGVPSLPQPLHKAFSEPAQREKRATRLYGSACAGRRHRRAHSCRRCIDSSSDSWAPHLALVYIRDQGRTPAQGAAAADHSSLSLPLPMARALSEASSSTAGSTCRDEQCIECLRSSGPTWPLLPARLPPPRPSPFAPSYACHTCRAASPSSDPCTAPGPAAF